MNREQYEQLDTPRSGSAAASAAAGMTTARNRPAASEAPPTARVHISPRIVLAAAGVYLALQFFDAVAKALMLFLFAFLFAIVLNAPVRWLEKRGIKRGLSIAGVALFLLAGTATVGYVFGPRLGNEVVDFVQDAPERTDQLRQRLQSISREYPQLASVLNSEALESEALMKRAGQILPRIGRYTLSLFGGLASLLFVFVAGLYMAASPKPLVRGVLTAVPPGYRASATRAFTRIVGQLESYVLATLGLMLLIGVLSWIGLSIIGVPNSLLYGVIAGFGEAIPTIGPIITAVPPALAALADEPRKALWVLGLFLVVQQIEGNLLVPWIMSRSLKLHPVSILFFVLALGSLVGLVGALLAVPAAIITKVLFEEFYERKRGPADGDALDAAVEQVVGASARAVEDEDKPGGGDDAPKGPRRGQAVVYDVPDAPAAPPPAAAAGR